MEFISQCEVHLNGIKSLVGRLKNQLHQLTSGNPSCMMTQRVGDFTFEKWTKNCSRLITATKEIQNQILDKYLSNWSSVQKHQLLDSVQSLVELCGTIWLDLWTELSLVGNSEGQTLREEVEALLGQLITQTFIITHQPPRVLKTNTRFPVAVRSLAGNLLTLTTPVRAYILNETQVRLAVSTYCPSQNLSTAGKLVYQEESLYHTTTGQTAANFQGILVKKIFRTEKKGQVSVMDEKFAIAFTAEVKCGRFTFNLKTFSLPVVVIVHTNQETNAWATIAWDNHFGQPMWVPFVVPDKVSRSECGQMLTNVFAESTGCYLCPADLNFLLNKISSVTSSSTSMDLSWIQFAKQPLPGLQFTFWQWFHSIIKLTREQLTNFWTTECRLIYGFISRSELENRLADKPDGTFFLRFSETSLGCLSIAYSMTNKFNQQVVVHLEPLSSKDLTIESLADRLNDFTNLKYLYPDMSKDLAFGQFYSPITNNKKGYTKIVLGNRISE